MDQEALRQLEQQVYELQQELQATQAKLQQVHRQIHELQGGAAGTTPQNFFKNPYRSPFSLENFIGLRLIHLVGIVVLVIGLSIGVKYAIDRQLISEAARILLAYGSGALLYLLSWRLRRRYAAFSAILFSGAMASLYFTSYGAFVYYHLLSFPRCVCADAAAYCFYRIPGAYLQPAGDCRAGAGRGICSAVSHQLECRPGRAPVCVYRSH
jgi:uncharacterized membrane protein